VGDLEGRGKREEGRGKREEGRGRLRLAFSFLGSSKVLDNIYLIDI
jgi:hypothetical protein